jgi:predicted Zn-dependent protease
MSITHHSHHANCGCDFARRRFLTKAVLASAGLAVAPLAIGGRACADLIPKPSPAKQKEIGDEAARQVLKQYREIDDGRAREFKAVAAKLLAALPDDDRKLWDFRFHFLDSKEVNAFALPGGNVFLFSGLFGIIETEDALAAVTGHEMTHVRRQHWASAYQKQQERDLGIAAILAITNAGQTVRSAADLADQAIGLKYSRGEEDQADQGGLEDMAAAGYNPQGMLDLFQALLKKTGNGGSIGGDFLSNHPLTTDRIKKTTERIAAIAHTSPFPPERPLMPDVS